MIKLSIITVTYNRYDKLKLNIESIKNQSFKNIEHIIVDNLSDDGTEQLIFDYKKKSSYPVIYIRETDKGIYNAMNKGIKAASGEWVHLLNSDDIYLSNDSLENLFNNNYGGYDILVSPVFIGKNIEKKESLWMPEYIEKLKHYRFPHQGTIIKNEFYKKHGYYNEKYKIISDAIYGIKNYPKSKYLILNNPLVIMSSGGVSMNFSFANIFEPIICTLFYHKYPIIYKLKKFFIYIEEPFTFFIIKYISPILKPIKRIIKK